MQSPKLRKLCPNRSISETGALWMRSIGRLITAGTHLAASIKVAEASKVIENAQRDINIAFVNELAKIFNLLDIDTRAVLEAAGTKWNFLPFRIGLVAGRRMNDSMGKYVATEVVKCMMRKDIKVLEARVLMLGITFKENCPDIRNTRAIDIYHELKTYDMEVDIYDPWADADEVKEEYGVELVNGSDLPNLEDYAVIILAVSHEKFKALNLEKKEERVIYDVKSFLDDAIVDKRL